MKKDMVWEKDGYILRLAQPEYAESYYAQNFASLDQEIARLTGSPKSFTRDEVFSFFRKCIDETDRFLFLLFAPNDSIVGESVINEIDWDLRCANFRIAIFNPNCHGKGIGTWMTEMTCNYAFSELKLHRLSLNVFSFNPRAQRVYEKTGFRVEGVLRDAVKDGDKYADDILMSILETEWKER